MTKSTWVLDIPETLGINHPFARRYKDTVFWSYSSTKGLDASLEEYQPERYSIAAYASQGVAIHDDTASELDITPYELQHVAIQKIVKAKEKGSPGFMLADPTGAGKMVIGSSLIKHFPENAKVLVIAPVSTLGSWREHLSSIVGERDGIIACNYESVWKLFSLPSDSRPAARNQFRTAFTFNGTPWETFDLIIFDESHRGVNLDTTIFEAIEKLSTRGTFLLSMSATPTVKLSDAAFLSPILGWKTGVRHNPDPLDDKETAYLRWFGDICTNLGMRMEVRSSTGISTPVTCRHNDTILRKAIYSGDDTKTIGISRTPEDLGMPSQSRTIHPVGLTKQQRDSYNLSWTEFCKEYELYSSKKSTNPDHMTTIVLRSLQALSLIKTDAVVDRVIELVDEGHSVVVVAWFQQTVAKINTKLKHRLPLINGLPSHPMTLVGETPLEGAGSRNNKIEAFQHDVITLDDGQRLAIPVIITSVHDGINLHQTSDDKRPRITLFADVLSGGRRILQAEGRAQRNGRIAPAEYIYARDTIDERMMHLTLSKASRSQVHVGNAKDSGEIESILGNFNPDIEPPGFDLLSRKDRREVLRIIDNGAQKQ